MKRFFRCNICGDIHYGADGPNICPTCQAKNTYKEIKKEEARKAMKL